MKNMLDELWLRWGLRTLRAAFLVAILVVAVGADVAGSPGGAKPYDLAEAYSVYDVLLPKEESYKLTKDTLIIAEETIADRGNVRQFLTPEAQRKFQDAIASFNEVAAHTYALQPRFRIGRPYKLVGQDALGSLPTNQGEGPYVELSAVGFNRGRTLAVVFAKSSCGGLCGSWRYHLLQKIRGGWTEVPGVIMQGAS